MLFVVLVMSKVKMQDRLVAEKDCELRRSQRSNRQLLIGFAELIPILTGLFISVLTEPVAFYGDYLLLGIVLAIIIGVLLQGSRNESSIHLECKLAGTK